MANIKLYQGILLSKDQLLDLCFKSNNKYIKKAYIEYQNNINENSSTKSTSCSTSSKSSSTSKSKSKSNSSSTSSKSSSISSKSVSKSSLTSSKSISYSSSSSECEEDMYDIWYYYSLQSAIEKSSKNKIKIITWSSDSNLYMNKFIIGKEIQFKINKCYYSLGDYIDENPINLDTLNSSNNDEINITKLLKKIFVQSNTYVIKKYIINEYDDDDDDE